jgi:hypothetical protein
MSRKIYKNKKPTWKNKHKNIETWNQEKFRNLKKKKKPYFLKTKQKKNKAKHIKKSIIIFKQRTNYFVVAKKHASKLLHTCQFPT